MSTECETKDGLSPKMHPPAPNPQPHTAHYLYLLLNVVTLVQQMGTDCALE